MTIIQYYLNQGYRVTSPYGMRIHPTTGEYKMHTGTDIAGPARYTPFPSYSDGIVQGVGFNIAWGNWVAVTEPSKKYTFFYAHFTDYQVKKGDIVRKGQQIARIGATGWATGVHVHLEVRLYDGTENGGTQWGDPEKFTLLGGSVNSMTTYIVKSGDTFAAIAAAHSLTLAQLVAANPQIADINRLSVGQIINIPSVQPTPSDVRRTKTKFTDSPTLFDSVLIGGTNYVEVRDFIVALGGKIASYDSVTGNVVVERPAPVIKEVIKEVPVEVIKEVIKEVPVEVIMTKPEIVLKVNQIIKALSELQRML